MGKYEGGGGTLHLSWTSAHLKQSLSLSSVASVQRPFVFFFLFRQNEGGRSVKLKCSSVKEAEDWREALEAESAVPLDSSHVSVESPVTEVTIYLLSFS